MLDGRDARGLSLPERARRRALLAQETTIAFPFSVRDVVSWGRTPWPRSAEDDAIVTRALTEQGLADLVDRPVTELSGGERKRVHLARVIAQGSPILMLDEADSDLDLIGRRALDDLVLRHAQRGGTVLVVSHDVNRLGRLCSHAIVLGSQRVHAHARWDDVITEPVLSAAYGSRVQVDVREGSRTVHLP
jgi:iron complex transport system ATP-binding protein